MPEKNARRVRKDVNLKLLIGVVSAILVLCVAVGFFAYKVMTEKVIADNVYVNSIHVGGLSVDEAAAKIKESVTEEYFNKTVEINYGGKSHQINMLGYVTVDAVATANAALAVNSDEEKVIVPFTFVLNDEEVKKEMITFALGVENKNNFITFNEDYTVANIDVSGIEEILDIDKTLTTVAENAGYDLYQPIDAPVIKKSDSGFADALYARVSREAVDASIGINDDESTYIIPEILGMEVSKDSFMSAYKSNGTFSVKVKVTFPELTTEKLDIEFYQDVLGTFTSNYDVNLRNRTANVTLAADFVNGTIVMPGHTFSYNSVVGPRTAARGFKPATVYTGEGTEEGLGGGICQVSSTLYCAQLRANLKTVSRTNHSYTVAYVPLGQDATVSYGVLDYVFENDTNYPIKIETTIGGGKLTVNIMGTIEDKSLTYDVVSVTNSTIAKKEITEEDPTLPLGETVVKQNGQNGAVVSTYKVYYKDGVETKREFIGKSTYVAMNRIVRVGTGEAVENSEGVVDFGRESGNTVPDDETGVVDPPETEISEEEPTVPETSDTGL